ncbi:MAG: hypothetical protein GWN00_01390 [Aliifodinibius sp.]|nr:hypothetical protein [Fodinibius sp.]NIV09985.1 hypothetical protein [Fodinibius sp.]NIY23516.1 hypothetical protein [Fodinibius sp.]
MVGPPYSVEEASVYSAHMEGGNNCFSKSEGGIRQQLSRDFGSVIIDKENYPEVLGTSDGIRAIRKLVVTEESSKDSVTFDSGSVGGSFEFPGPIDTSDPVITTVEEVYMYDDDGNLTGDRVGKKVTEDTGYVMTNTFRVYTPITEQLTGVLTYSVETKYNDKDEVISSSTTGVQIDTVAADRSGPVPESAFMSVEGNESLREKKLKAYSSNIIKKLNEDKSISDLSEVPTGGFYVTVENLTLEEIESYLNDYYVLDASMNYVASFSTKHADVRGLIGGHIQLTSGTLNRPEFHDATTSAKLELKDSGFLSAINCTPFRVTGIVLDWDRETTPEISVAMCQLV